jgi:hypothetical protein
MPAKTKSDLETGQPRWLGPAKFLLLLMFALACLLLTRAMVENHFFSGGSLNYRSSSH